MCHATKRDESRCRISRVDDLNLLRRTNGPGPTHDTSPKASLLELVSFVCHISTCQCSIGIVNIATNSNGSAFVADDCGAL